MWLVSCSLLVAICVVGGASEERESRLVSTAQGPVRGYQDPDSGLFEFYNIPYATAPTGPHKFRGPLPPPTWQEPLEAINRLIACLQAGDRPESETMQEDCLVVNIYVPDTAERNLPVVVYFHGGAYQNGRGTNLKPTHFARSKNVIIVTFNYRVGIHGFLCLGTPDAPGNAGMKDQVALLRWVNRNIANFGGNPFDVTIAGCSAGSSSVDLQMLSKATVGLFNKVISSSGSSLCTFSVVIHPLENAKKYAKRINFTNVDDIHALEEFYKTVNFELLLLDTFRDNKDTGVVFAPCVERYTGGEMFLSEAPYHILRNRMYRKLPVMYGFSNMEGLMRLQYFEDWKDGMNEKFSDFLPGNLYFPNEDVRKAVAQRVKEFYFGDKPVGEDNILSYIDFNSDVLFAQSTLWSIDIQVRNEHDNIYLYEYSYVDAEESLVPYTNVSGAEHCAQQYSLLDGTKYGYQDEINLSEGLRNIKAITREMWHNFITTGEPVPSNSSLPSWPPVGSDRSPHMSFGQTVELRGQLLEERARFWDQIYEQYYRAPQPPNPHYCHKPRPK